MRVAEELALEALSLMKAHSAPLEQHLRRSESRLQGYRSVQPWRHSRRRKKGYLALNASVWPLLTRMWLLLTLVSSVPVSLSPPYPSTVAQLSRHLLSHHHPVRQLASPRLSAVEQNSAAHPWSSVVASCSGVPPPVLLAQLPREVVQRMEDVLRLEPSPLTHLTLRRRSGVVR